MDRIIIIKSQEEKPVKHDLDSDLCRYSQRVCNGLNIAFGKRKNSGRD